jgi:hypothetical protein
LTVKGLHPTIQQELLWEMTSEDQAVPMHQVVFKRNDGSLEHLPIRSGKLVQDLRRFGEEWRDWEIIVCIAGANDEEELQATFGSLLQGRLGVPVKGAGLADGIEVFPKHDAIGSGAFGNAIRGPLGIHRGANRRFWFYGADYTLEDQIAYVNGLRKVTEEELRRFISGKVPEPDFSSRLDKLTSMKRKPGNGRSEFCILEQVGTVRKVGRNYVARCPSCADCGHDRSGDNLAILIEDPRFYKCWAGCTKEMIRAALGCPIRVPHSA